MTLLAIGVGSAIFVVGRLIFSTETVLPTPVRSASTAAIIMAAIVSGTAVLLWFLVPLARRNRRLGEDDGT